MNNHPAKSILALGIGSKNQQGEWLEAFFPSPVLNPSTDLLQAIQPILSEKAEENYTQELFSKEMHQLLTLLAPLEAAKGLVELAMSWLNSAQPIVLCHSHLQTPALSVPAVYLHLHALSHRLTRPHGLNLEGIFARLPNLAWTNEGPIDLRELPARQAEARGQGKFLQVRSVDKFPPMLDYIVPSGVRVGDGARVRLGAYLGEGTTVMHEGFVNFNAGTLGAGMIEGRISAGVVVGNNSDLGGGCSTMGTLSGGNKTRIALGENCLVGANAGVGIPLGDRCTIEAGLYLTAGSKVTLLDAQGQSVKQVKALELSGQSDLLFRRNSQSGAIECLTNQSAIELNQELHQNN